MNRFAQLLDRLGFEHGRNAKLRLMTEYFRQTPDPERGFTLAALTGALSFPHAKPGIIRTLIAERADPVLFELSHVASFVTTSDSVGGSGLTAGRRGHIRATVSERSPT